MTQEVLKQALDALETCGGYLEQEFDLIKVDAAITAIEEALAQLDATMQSLKDLNRSICDEVGKAAFAQLAQPQQEPPFSVQQAYAMAQVCLDLHEALGCKWGDNPYLALAGLREAQPQQEPVNLRRGDLLRCIETDELCTVWATSPTGNTLIKWSSNNFGDYTAEQIGELFWLESTQQEPVACMVENDDYGVMVWPIKHIHEAGTYCEENEFPVLLYTSPPQRKPLNGVLVPLNVLEAAEMSLGSFCSDHGWAEEDMQNMDNLSAYIAEHKAAHGIKE